jgi:LytR cell envelope-related transcriptional attenuator
LIGVAVIAAIIGLADLATNGDTTPAAAAPPAAPTGTPSPEPPPPPPPLPATGLFPPTEPLATDGGGVPVPSFNEPAPAAAPPAPGGAPAPAGAPDAPGAAQGQGPAGGARVPAPVPGASGAESGRDTSGSGASAARMPLRVYNNSTITGLAARAAEDFRRAGWPIDVVGNYPQGIIPTTTVYYRPGTAEEAAAQALGQQFGMRVSPRFEGLEDASPGLIVIVTNDYGR